jgi:UDP-glucose 4-epimerase
MKYLLLGGAGFIGKHLTTRLINDGHEVFVVDNCVTSSKPTAAVTFYRESVQNFHKLESLIKECDVVYFLAGSVGVKHIVENPYETLTNNLSLAMEVVPLIAKHNKLLMFSSTSEVYGNGPFKEDGTLSIVSAENLRWSYASAKLTTEFLVASSGAPFKIFRFFNITGPGQLPNFGMVLPRFVNAAKSDQDIVVYGDGSQVRSFCHVSDAVDMMCQIEKCKDGIYNVGNDDPVTMMELAHTVKRILNSNSNIVTKPLDQVYAKNSGDINRRIPDLTKLKSSINFKTAKSLDDIILDMAND